MQSPQSESTPRRLTLGSLQFLITDTHIYKSLAVSQKFVLDNYASKLQTLS